MPWLTSFCVALLSACGPAPESQPPAYKNKDLLVSGSSLAGELDRPGQIIIDMRSATDYNAGHISGAINLSLASFNKGGKGLDSTDLKSPTEVATALGAAGLTSDARLVVYGKQVDSNAGRMFWLLEYLGASDVHVLDGGFEKWVVDGLPTETAVRTLPAATFNAALRPEKLALKSDVLAHYEDTQNWAVVDSRDATDPTGTKTGGNQPFDQKHIPNAVNLLTSDFVNDDATVKSASDLKALLEANGIAPHERVITHCYIGYRSGQGYFMFRLLGHEVANYDGSWTEWQADPSLPVAP